MPMPEQTEGDNQGGEELNLDSLEELTVDELLDFAKEKALKEKELEKQFAEYRSNSEKGVKKLLDKQKEEHEIDDEKISSIVDQKVQQKYINSTLNSVKNQLGTEEREAFEEEFNDITEGKVLTEDNLDKYIEKTLKLIGRQKGNEIISIAANAPVKRQSTKTEDVTARKESAKTFVEEFGL